MQKSTIKKLVEINSQFYQTGGKYFDNSRNYAWEGWEKLVPTFAEQFSYKPKQIELDKGEMLHAISKAESKKLTDGKRLVDHVDAKQGSKKLRVLDIGCGNARFADFLNLRGFEIDYYVGVDFSDYLLEMSDKRLQILKSKINFEYKLLKVDLVNEVNKLTDELGEQKFDLVVLFGVMHHMAGEDNQQRVIDSALSFLDEGSFFVFTTWQFLDSPRLQRRIVSKNESEGIRIYDELGIDIDELDEGDFILDWNRGVKAYRYCHYYKQDDTHKLLNNRVRIVSTYLSDGKEGNVNKYYICG